MGDRLGIGLRNSPQFALAAFAAWKLGAVPVPMRWDLPDWELGRLREAIDGKVHLGEEDLDNSRRCRSLHAHQKNTTSAGGSTNSSQRIWAWAKFIVAKSP